MDKLSKKEIETIIKDWSERMKEYINNMPPHTITINKFNRPQG